MKNLIRRQANKTTPTKHDIFSWTEVGYGKTPCSVFMWKKGVYAITSGKTILYIGHSDAVGLRIQGHPQVAKAKSLGYKTIRSYVFTSDDHYILEIELITMFNPVLNKQYRKNNQIATS